MVRVLISPSAEARQAIEALFNQSPPVLVEVRFPDSGTSPDWRLCEDEDDLEQVLGQVSPGAELHLSSVWDLKSVKDSICLRKPPTATN